MTVPITNISVSSLWNEANVGSPTNLSLENIAFTSYFSGPGGAGGPDNNWGQGEFGGADVIFGLTVKAQNFEIGEFAGLDYFYDQANYQCIFNVANFSTGNLQDVQLSLKDSTDTYTYIVGSTGPIMSGGIVILDVSLPTSPLINTAYWEIVSVPDIFFPACTADLSINATPFFTGQPVNPRPVPTFFNHTSFGTQTMGLVGGATGFEFGLTFLP
jgi:hypothetical protein